MWLDNVPIIEIANHFGVTAGSIRYHLGRSIIPQWRNELIDCATGALARIKHAGSVAYRRWKENPEDAVAAGVFKWSLDRECKILGHDTPGRAGDEHEPSYRVAGKTPGEVDREMVGEIAREMLKLKRQQEKEEQLLGSPLSPCEDASTW
jgi:hypothetical protein